VVLAYFLVKTLADRTVESIPQDVKVAKVEDQKKPEDLPPPPPPDLTVPPPPPFVPQVEIQIQQQQVAPPAAITTTHVISPPAPPPAPPAPKAKPVPKIDRAHTGDTDRFYPPISKRLGEEGSVIVQVAIAPDGHVVDAKVAKSSGFSRLDAAAVEYSKSALKFEPFVFDEAVWTEYKVVFQLR